MTSNVAAGVARNAKWVDAMILVGSVMFVLALLVAAIFVPEIRLLHALQAMIYVAVCVLTRRRSAWGFGAGAFIALFWNYLVLIASPIGRDGVHALLSLVSTGHVQQPGGLIQLFAGFGHVLIIVACLVGFLRARPRAPEWGRFVGGGVAAIAYLGAIIFAVAPPDIVAHFASVFGR